MIGAATLGVLSLGRCWWTGQRGQTPKWHWGIPAVELQGCDACRGCTSAASIEMWNSGFQGDPLPGIAGSGFCANPACTAGYVPSPSA